MIIQDDLQQRWWQLEMKLMGRFGKKPDMEAILFLIGLQEVNCIRKKITKEQKQDLMHVAICTVLLPAGYYEKNGTDEDGWPHFTQLKELPATSLLEQENFLKDFILFDFQQQEI